MKKKKTYQHQQQIRLSMCVYGANACTVHDCTRRLYTGRWTAHHQCANVRQPPTPQPIHTQIRNHETFVMGGNGTGRRDWRMATTCIYNIIANISSHGSKFVLLSVFPVNRSTLLLQFAVWRCSERCIAPARALARQHAVGL